MENILLKITNVFKSRFFQLGSIVLVGSFLVNILNYTFNVVMGRMLTPEEFGEGASLIGLMAIISVPSASLLKLMAKYSADFKEKGKNNFIADLFRIVAKRSFQLGLLAMVVFLCLIPFLVWFLKIEVAPLVVFSLLLPLTLLVAINQGVLQGLHRFISSSVTSFLAAFFKLSLAILFVYLGFSVTGVIIALVIGYIISYFFSLRQIQSNIQIKDQILPTEVKEEINKKEIILFAKSMFLVSLFMVLLTNTDVILAKHYLSAFLAGQYAALSITGKIIFYASGAFLTVMFPMVSASLSNGDGKEKDILKMAFVLNGLIAGGVLLLFLFFPTLFVKLLFGAKYLVISSYLVWFSLAMFCCAFSQVFITYFMATNAKNYLVPLAFAILLQIGLIVCFHADFLQITLAVLTSNVLLLILMILTYYKNSIHKKSLIV